MDLSPAIGLWLGFILSLMALSLIIRDNLLSRLAQYSLVGSATGYLMVLVIQDILRPKLFEPLLATGRTGTGGIAFDLLIPLILGLGLLITGLDGTIRQGRAASQDQAGRNDAAADESQTIVAMLRGVTVGIGRIALMVIVGVGIANALTGTIQGTLLPQFWQATQIELGSIFANSATSTSAEAGTIGLGAMGAVGALVALFMTIATILHLYVVPHRAVSHRAVSHSVVPRRVISHRASGEEDANSEIDQAHGLEHGEDSGNAIQRIAAGITNNFVVRAWAAVGKRALWFAAGVLFARLAASRLSLLIARIDYFVQVLETTSIWQQLIKLIEPFFG